MKISLFVLAGMISGSSAKHFNCRRFNNNPIACYHHRRKCAWHPLRPSPFSFFVGFCWPRTGGATAASFVNLEVDAGDYPVQEDDVGDKNVDSSGYDHDAASGEYDYDYEEEEDMDEDGGEDIDTSSDLGLASDGEPNGSDSIIKKSYLRAN